MGAVLFFFALAQHPFEPATYPSDSVPDSVPDWRSPADEQTSSAAAANSFEYDDGPIAGSSAVAAAAAAAAANAAVFPVDANAETAVGTRSSPPPELAAAERARFDGRARFDNASRPEAPARASSGGRRRSSRVER